MNNSKNLLLITAVCLAAFFAVSGCGEARGKNRVLISIGEIKVTAADFDERISNLPDRYKEIIKKNKNEYVQELINDTLLYREALRKKVHEDKDVRKVIKEAQKKILIARLLKDEVDDAITVTDKDIESFYNDNKEQYMTSEMMRASHILVSSKEEAKVILAGLASGADFGDLARVKSIDPTAQRGGDIGYFPKGQLMPEFEDACGRLNVGGITDVVKTKLGWHVIKLTDRKFPQTKSLEQVADDIRVKLRAIKRQKAFNKLLDDLRKNTKIVISKEL
ncbi:MAG: peptidylprolyl isomerase [Candidatus Omnitrophota bacterium]